MTHITSPPHDGFTLIETLIATALIVTAVAGLAQLFALSVRFTRESGQFGVALVAAQDKLEFLRARRFDYDDTGAAVTDPHLRASPPDTLTRDVGGFVDWLDAAGRAVGAEGADYVRRWRVSEIAADDPEAIAIDVCVFRPPATNAAPAGADACLATIRVRQP
jgi:prepilin-type N-terminal cleavage/methylation domain-containing protein